MKTYNPAMFFAAKALPASDRMRIGATVWKTGLLLLVVLLGASGTWTLYFELGIEAVLPWFWKGLGAAFALALLTIIKPRWAAVTAPPYAFCEGVALGGLSAILEAKFPGIVVQAVVLTFGTALVMLLSYSVGWLKTSPTLIRVITIATVSVALLYVVGLIVRMNGGSIPFLHEGGLGCVIFSSFVMVLAALSLILDFNEIETHAAGGAPRHMEWYFAFSIMLTLIWLYVEILRLLSFLAEIFGDD